MKHQRCLPFDSRYLTCDLTEHQRLCYEAYGKAGNSIGAAARLSGKYPQSVSLAIQRVQKKGAKKFGKLVWDDEVKEIVAQPLKILLFDIEFSPTSCYVFRFWNQNIRDDQIIEHGYMLSFAALWHGDHDDQIIYEEARTRKKEKGVVKKLFDLLEEADVAVGHNLKQFDIKVTKGRGLVHGLPPLIQPKMIDTLAVCRKEFKLPKNSLGSVAEFLGVAPKSKHSEFPGISLWTECLKGNDDAWKVMQEYNIQDVITLRDVFDRLRGHDTSSPNLGLFKEDTRPVCPKCGSGELVIIAPIKTQMQLYRGYRCVNCGGLCRGRSSILDKETRDRLLTNAR